MSIRHGASRPAIERSSYSPPGWQVEQVEMNLVLARESTRVTTRLTVRRNPSDSGASAPLELNGSGLETESISVDGRRLSTEDYRIEGETLHLELPEDRATVETVVTIHPAENTALEGLYAAGDMLLTQCEAEGFRKITWYPDRPDVMARFRVRLEADRSEFPILLSNGNCVESGELADDRHYAVWDDPFAKPSYLFAVVAGDLAVLEDTHTTASGREVTLKVWSDPADLDRLQWAMESLKQAMRWDEQRFGLEYDLDIYHIVATHDFNMGAMENKGLNIFNSRYVLADPETATDADFEAIEAVIGHEYFHNWTGNRVTCRDWFQLTLKEGLTVFRDQEFTSDLRSRGVKRIQDAANLKARQFLEDAGPMAHPVRPERYIEINNFYTSTVYEKGAEVVRMYQTLLGREGFRKGLDLYFRRHDGQAVTCDDFLAAMADANDTNLDLFERWYRQTGTPTLRASIRREGEETVLALSQNLTEHPDNRGIGALMMPIKVGFLDADNRSLPVTLSGEDEPGPETRLLVLDQPQAEFRFRDLPEEAVPSLLRDFSAPVKLIFDWSAEELARLAGFDPDPVNRHQAMRRLSERVLDQAIADAQLPNNLDLLEQAWTAVFDDDSIDPALAAELLTLPTENELAQERDPVDVDGIHRARSELRSHLAGKLETRLLDRIDELAPQGPWSGDGRAVAERSLHNHCLEMLALAGRDSGAGRAREQFESADNMTDRMAALRALVLGGHDATAALESFEARYRDNALVMDKWFAVQAMKPHGSTVEKIAELRNHPAFRMTNPNKVRAVIGVFAVHNPVAFHRADGAGYRLVGEALHELDELNPQVAARLAGAFNRWRAYGEKRSAMMKAELEELAAKPGLSPDVEEIVTAALGVE
ncbi:aminopeptidase N [Wenzhouxiangella sp. AB-CW3]|uniref:aminopeptidase N n=1 Tax=Wenzhouxiangella sp. AB-CW3 TaxID=2771012 RepID=UPI00168B0FDD|nr:aminopeptidase N [Wenzhouxiangella sp. AB-CW3]QOC21849.1 aminopeptidase N [Wenzhouxiangella sp. AB-CW3]